MPPQNSVDKKNIPGTDRQPLASVPDYSTDVVKPIQTYQGDVAHIMEVKHEAEASVLAAKTAATVVKQSLAQARESAVRAPVVSIPSVSKKIEETLKPAMPAAVEHAAEVAEERKSAVALSEKKMPPHAPVKPPVEGSAPRHVPGTPYTTQDLSFLKKAAGVSSGIHASAGNLRGTPPPQAVDTVMWKPRSSGAFGGLLAVIVYLIPMASADGARAIQWIDERVLVYVPNAIVDFFLPNFSVRSWWHVFNLPYSVTEFAVPMVYYFFLGAFFAGFVGNVVSLIRRRGYEVSRTWLLFTIALFLFSSMTFYFSYHNGVIDPVADVLSLWNYLRGLFVK